MSLELKSQNSLLDKKRFLMSEFNHLNSVYINYLTPLIKWRVMDLESLRRECVTTPTYSHFARVIRKMEKVQVVQGYRHPFNGKKYIFFSSLGEKQVAHKSNSTAISKESLIHDIKVSEIARNFKALGWVDSIQLEHELTNKRDFRAAYKVIPDALMEVTKAKHRYQLALELELTQKNKQRIREKAKQFIISTQYDYVLYFFSKESVAKTYRQEILSAVGEKNLHKFIFVTDQFMTAQESKLQDLTAYIKDRPMKLSAIFNSENGV